MTHYLEVHGVLVLLGAWGCCSLITNDTSMETYTYKLYTINNGGYLRYGYNDNQYPNFLGIGPMDNLRIKRNSQKLKVTEYTDWRSYG